MRPPGNIVVLPTEKEARRWIQFAKQSERAQQASKDAVRKYADRLAGFYVVVSEGPNSEPDYDDARYWLVSARQTTIGDNAASFIPTSATDPEHRHLTATNLAELNSGKHEVPYGSVVRAFSARSAESESTRRFWFISGTGAESFYLTCGMFSGAGTVEAHNIAIGNGGRWRDFNTPVGKDISPEHQAVFDLPFRTGVVNDAAIYNGELYICGTIRINPVVTETPALEFDTIHLAKWDATQHEWVDVADGLNNLFFYPDTASALLIYDGKLLIGGLNDDTNVVQFDGTSYSDFGSVTGGQALGQVNILYEWNGYVYAGTTGSTGFGVSGASVLRSNGAAWSSVGDDVPTGATYALESHDDGSGEKLYVGGAFSQSIGGITRRHFTRVNSSNEWEHLWIRSGQSGFSNVASAQVRALCSYRGSLLIGGQNLSPGPLCCVWNGFKIIAQQSQLAHHSSGGSTPTPFVRSIVRHGENVLYGGQFFIGTMSDLGVSVRRICKLNEDDDVYERLPGDGFNGTVRRVIEFDGSTYAVGDFDGHFARRTNTEWELLDDPGPIMSAEVVSWNGDDYLAIAGSFGIKLWDGAELTSLVSSAGVVRKIRVDGSGDILAVGNFTVIGSTNCTGVARIRFDAGTVVDALATSINAAGGQWDVLDVTLDGTYIYVVGRFNSIGNAEGTNSSVLHVARLNVSTNIWSDLGTSGTEPNTQCLSCEMFGGNLYVSQDASTIKMWNGSTWNIPGSGKMIVNRAPQLLRTVGGELLIDAQSSSDGRTRLVAWDGSSVRVIAHGNPQSDDNGLFDGPIHTASIIDGKLIVGGEFVYAGSLRKEQLDVPAQCLIAMDPTFRWTGYLGGVGEKLASSAIGFGTSTSVNRVRVLPVPGLSSDSVVAVGDFPIANEVRSNGIAAHGKTLAMPVGLGIGPIRTTSPIAGTVGVNDAIRLSDGKVFAGGQFSEGRNLTPDPEWEEGGGIVYSPALIEILGNRRFKAAPGHDMESGADEVSFPIKRDSWVNQQSPTQNYGDDDGLTVGVASGESQHALFHVDLRELGPIVGDDIGSASLDLSCKTARTNEHDFRVSVIADVPWGEFEINWNIFNSSHSIIDTAALDFAAPASTGTFHLNVTSLIRWIVDAIGTMRFTLIIRKVSSENGSFRIHSREAADVGNRPKLTINLRNKDFTEIFALEEFGDDDGVPLLWASHNGEEHISRYNHMTHEWVRRGANIEASNFLSRGLIRFKDKLYHYGSARLSASPSTDRTIIRSTGDGTWEDASVAGMVTCRAACVTMLDGVETLVVGGSMSGSQNSVWKSTDGQTWQSVGPQYIEMPAPENAARVNCDGLAWVDFSALGNEYGPMLLATALTIGVTDSSVNNHYAAFYDAADDSWIPIADFEGLTGFWRAHAVRAGVVALMGYNRTAPIITNNPDNGKLIVDGLAEWNPRDGWRRMGGRYGVNDSVYRARG